MRQHQILVLIIVAGAFAACTVPPDMGLDASSMASGAGNPCAAVSSADNGIYCGASRQSGFTGGDSDVLYDCENGHVLSAFKCAQACNVAPAGESDSCSSSPPQPPPPPPAPDAGTIDSGSDTGPTGPDAGPTSSAPGYLHTSGSQILDSANHVVQMTGLSWFGLETPNYAPHGLWQRSMGDMLDQIKSLGFNTMRVPFCNQMFDAGVMPTSIDYSKNPDLVGLTPLQVLDKLVAGAGARGIRIFLDRHRPDSGSQSELWYTGQYSESRWISDWVMLANHYAGNTTVVGADLHNEPHGSASWGDGNAQTDWAAAAGRAGNAVLAANPNWLIIVEGVEKTGGTSYWWGGNLSQAGAHPVALNVPGRLVYSTHDYPATVFAQTWFSDSSYPNNLPNVWDTYWGYLQKQGTAPVLVGEFGTKLQTQSDKQWFSALASYMHQGQTSFTFWCWNPDSGDTGGIVQDDWATVNQDKMAVLTPILAPFIK